MSNKLENLIKDLKNACDRFEDSLAQEKNEYIRDSAIQRFEFTFELMWKTLKAYLEDKGVRVYSPKDAIKGAFQSRLIDDDPKWIEMIETRNRTSHVYNEAMVESVYQDLPAYLPLIKKLIEDLA